MIYIVHEITMVRVISVRRLARSRGWQIVWRTPRGGRRHECAATATRGPSRSGGLL